MRHADAAGDAQRRPRRGRRRRRRPRHARRRSRRGSARRTSPRWRSTAAVVAARHAVGSARACRRRRGRRGRRSGRRVVVASPSKASKAAPVSVTSVPPRAGRRRRDLVEGVRVVLEAHRRLVADVVDAVRRDRDRLHRRGATAALRAPPSGPRGRLAHVGRHDVARVAEAHAQACGACCLFEREEALADQRHRRAAADVAAGGDGGGRRLVVRVRQRRLVPAEGGGAVPVEPAVERNSIRYAPGPDIRPPARRRAGLGHVADEQRRQRLVLGRPPAARSRSGRGGRGRSARRPRRRHEAEEARAGEEDAVAAAGGRPSGSTSSRIVW